jgi:aryl-alcohol dehydrogenase-like predicted oxidoreductase
MQYRRVGKWGLKLPEISLGLWHNFGGTAALERSREIVRRRRRHTSTRAQPKLPCLIEPTSAQ